MMRHLAVLAVLGLALPDARADVLRLRTGGTIEGIVIEDGGDYVVEVPFGTMRVGKELVESVEAKATPLGEHKQRAAALADGDAEGWYQLGLWARRHDLSTIAEEDFERAIEANPDHAWARKALGHEQVDGKWLTRDEAMAARGMVQVDGKWMTKEAADLVRALAEAKAIEAETRAAEARARAEEKRAQREAAAAEREARIAELREQEYARAAARRRTYSSGYYDPYGYYPYRTVLFYGGTYCYPYGSQSCHGGTPYYETSDGHAVTIEQSGANSTWVHHSGGCGADQHTTIHSSDDGHIVTEQFVNGQQQLVHQTSPGATPDLTLQHR